jgi:hypothetical protein
MGTPTVIKFTGNENYGSPKTIALYRHMDGDPVTQLDVFATILRKAFDLANEYEYKAPHIAERCIVTPSTLTGLYIGETTGTFGMAASIIPDPDSNYAEWIYTVNVDDGIITVTDEDENPVDPYSYLEKLHDEYVPTHRESLDVSLARLADMGFKVLPGERPER